MIPLFYGMPFLAVGITDGIILRSTGNIKMPEVVFGIAGIINLFLDYVLIIGVSPFTKLGIKGVAIGTVISWILILIATGILLSRDRLLSFSFLSNRRKNVAIIKDLFQLGLPSVVTQLVTPTTLMYLTYWLGKVSSNAVAAFGVAGRIETLMLIGLLGVSSAATPFIAQNLGAKQHLRIDEAIVFWWKGICLFGWIINHFLIAFH